MVGRSCCRDWPPATFLIRAREVLASRPTPFLLHFACPGESRGSNLSKDVNLTHLCVGGFAPIMPTELCWHREMPGASSGPSVGGCNSVILTLPVSVSQRALQDTTSEALADRLTLSFTRPCVHRGEKKVEPIGERGAEVKVCFQKQKRVFLNGLVQNWSLP